MGRPKGFKHSKETRKKIGDGNKGNHYKISDIDKELIETLEPNKLKLMLQFEKETGKSSIRGGKITGQFEYWLWQQKKLEVRKRKMSEQYDKLVKKMKELEKRKTIKDLEVDFRGMSSEEADKAGGLVKFLNENKELFDDDYKLLK